MPTPADRPVPAVALALVVTTLGRIEPLKTLMRSLRGELLPGDRVVIVAQLHRGAVEAAVAEVVAGSFDVAVITSPRGASTGRNAGVSAIPRGENPLICFPNDTTWFPTGTMAALRAAAPGIQLGALTVRDENGPKFTLPPSGTRLDRWNVWSVIEMGLLARRDVLERLGGFDEHIGTGASTPWQAGEATDLLLRAMYAGLTREFVWLPPEVWVGGVAEAHGLLAAERRHKLRAYNRGLGRLVSRWSYPWWWRLAFVVGGLLFGMRHRRSHGALDGWWVFLGRVEGALGRTLTTKHSRTAAVTR